MAKPIRATPILRGEDAKRFLKEWFEEMKHPSKERQKFFKETDKYRSLVDNASSGLEW